jgi:hypothetical protein
MPYASEVEHRARVRRLESLRNRVDRRHRDDKLIRDVKSVLDMSRLTYAERGRILGACLCMMEEVRLGRRLVAAVRV